MHARFNRWCHMVASRRAPNHHMEIARAILCLEAIHVGAIKINTAHWIVSRTLTGFILKGNFQF